MHTECGPTHTQTELQPGFSLCLSVCLSAVPLASCSQVVAASNPREPTSSGGHKKAKCVLHFSASVPVRARKTQMLHYKVYRKS